MKLKALAFTRAFSNKTARLALMVLVAAFLVTLAYADDSPGVGGCCAYNGGVYCPQSYYCSDGKTVATNDYVCSTYACGFLWLDTCYQTTNYYCPPLED
jgi:hypothetical protein